MREELKKLRKKKGFTQEQISRKAGIARTTYTNIERGLKNPSFDTAVKIKNILGTNDDNIFLIINVSKRNEIA